VEARNNYERYKTLLADRFVAEAEFDRYAAIYKTAQSAVDSAQAQVNIAQNRLGYAQLVADAGGTVTAVGAEPGEVVRAGGMIVQVARQGGRDAVFDVSPQIKNSAPPRPHGRASRTAGTRGAGGGGGGGPPPPTPPPPQGPSGSGSDSSTRLQRCGWEPL